MNRLRFFLCISVSGRKKRYRPVAFGGLESIIIRALGILLWRGVSVIVIAFELTQALIPWYAGVPFDKYIMASISIYAHIFFQINNWNWCSNALLTLHLHKPRNCYTRVTFKFTRCIGFKKRSVDLVHLSFLKKNISPENRSVNVVVCVYAREKMTNCLILLVYFSVSESLYGMVIFQNDCCFPVYPLTKIWISENIILI